MPCKINDVFSWRDKAGLPKHEQGPKARSGSGHYGIQRKDIANDEIMCVKKKEENREYVNTDNTVSLMVQMVKNPPVMQETQVQSLSQEDPLEKGIAILSSILAWTIHGQRSLVGYSPWGRTESDTTAGTSHACMQGTSVIRMESCH